MTDDRTIAVYDAKASEYADLTNAEGPDKHLKSFINDLQDGDHVLDLGCGPATASYHMAKAGLRPDPIDASAGMVELANETFDIGARQASFDDIKGHNIYDAIWANFSLLHAPAEDLPRYLSALQSALKTGGQFHIGMKTGEGMRRDGIDRRYTYVSVDGLHELLTAAGFSVTETDEGAEVGLDGVLANWVICRAVNG